jgi:potassium/hydrogen antiporter
MPCEVRIMPLELGMVTVGLLLLASVVASRLSDRFGVPALLFFLLVGMLAGSDGPGGIYFDDAALAQSLGVVALAFILFSGGLDTHWPSARPVLPHALALASLGVLATASLVGLVASLLLDLTPTQGLLLGAIVSSTDAAAVFSILRSHGTRLPPRLQSLLELESGSNDPMAVFLTIGLIQWLREPATTLLQLVGLFGIQLVVGALGGYLGGRAVVAILQRLRLGTAGLYPVLTLALVLVVYGATTLASGNGFLAVYGAGIVIGKRDFPHKESLVRFHDALAWLMQIAMFLTLGLLVFPSRLVPILGVGFLLAVTLVFVARPLAILLTLAPSPFSLREKSFLAWVGLRGAVPIVLATYPLIADLPEADLIFNVVFFVVLTSVLLQGTTVARAARWLGVEAPAAAPPEPSDPDDARGT